MDYVKEINRLIERVFSDTSVSRDETREKLQEIQSEVETRLAALDDQ